MLTEHTNPHDEFTHRLCASWEMQALREKAYDIRVSILRTGLVIGRNGGFLDKMLLSFKFGFGAQLGHGKQLFDIRQSSISAIIIVRMT